MRRVNKRSRELRHLNSGTSRTSFISKAKKFFQRIFSGKKTQEFSITHDDSRYEGYSLPKKQTNSRGLFSMYNTKKVLTHAGILSVCGFTIMSNACFGDSCQDIQSMTKLAMASATNSDLVEIDVNSDNTGLISNEQKNNQLASSINEFTGSEDKKAQINQALKEKEDDENTDIALIQESYLDKTNSPVTSVSDATARKHIITHIVKDSETLWSVADKYGLTTDTIKWSNGMNDSGVVVSGQELYILPMNGIYYTVQDGDTISSLVEKYKSDTSEIEKWNDFSSEGMAIGRKIILPGGEVPPPPKPVVQPSNNYTAPSNNSYYTPQPSYSGSSAGGTGQFSWPTSGIAISQYFGSTSFNPWHTGIDLDARSGWDIYASDGGTVTKATWGWGGGYGNHIVIDHGNGYQTLYGHLSSLDVGVGSYVSKGQRIGTMGSTGWSTGPHLHFEIRYNGSFLNPLNYL